MAGLPRDSIEIVYTGIRPGEKLFEELYYGEEAPLPTTHRQIQIANCRDFDFEVVKQDIEYLVSIAFGKTDRIRAKIREIVPEYCGQAKTVFSAGLGRIAWISSFDWCRMDVWNLASVTPLFVPFLRRRLAEQGAVAEASRNTFGPQNPWGPIAFSKPRHEIRPKIL